MGEKDKLIVGLTYNYLVSQVIRDGLMYSTLQCDYRYIPGEFQMMSTVYVADMNRENVGYIYNHWYRQVWMPNNAEYVLSQKEKHCYRD